jgi:MFS family permease
MPMTSSYDALSSPIPDDSARWRILALLSVVQLLGMSLWFTAGATASQLRLLWDLDAGQAAMLTTAVQLGFVAGTAVAALLNLADIVAARRYLAASAVLAAAANAAIIVAPGYGAALVARFLTGFFLAGVYPPAMKMAATWFRSARGLAIGTIVGALTVGKALPYLTGALPGFDWRLVAGTASAGALVAAALVMAGYRDGPFAFPQRPFSLRLVGTVLCDRPTRLAIGGYLGHMWELYAMWSAVALFLTDYFGARAATIESAAVLGGVAAFFAIAAGGAGSVLAGIWADRFGRERVASAAMIVSGACALVIGWLFAAPPWLVLPLALLWGFSVVADSAQFSALVTEVAPPHAVGTALTLQTSLGFALTAVTIWGVAEVVERTASWGVAFTLLAIGPALGIVAMVRLQIIREATDEGVASLQARNA